MVSIPLVCPDCGSNRFRYEYTQVVCTNCDLVIKEYSKSTKSRRRRGLAVPLGTPEHREKVSRLTKEAMARPDVQAKLRATRGPLKNAHKLKLSQAMQGTMPFNMTGAVERSGGYNSKFGWIEIGGKMHYMRSGWERNFARYLQWLKELGEIKDWDYECFRFLFEKIKRGNNSYLPDFKIIENDDSHYWVEVKGYVTQGARTKLKRMRLYYPNERVDVVGKDEYYALRKDLKNLISDWE